MVYEPTRQCPTGYSQSRLAALHWSKSQPVRLVDSVPWLVFCLFSLYLVSDTTDRFTKLYLAERHAQKAMLLDNHLGNHGHPTPWEKSTKSGNGPAV
jgi:hypothetical protein